MKKTTLITLACLTIFPVAANADCPDPASPHGAPPGLVAATARLQLATTGAANDYIAGHEARTADYLRRRRTMSECLSQLADFNISAGIPGLPGLPDILGMIEQAAARAVCGTVDTTISAIHRPIDQAMALPGHILEGTGRQISVAGPISAVTQPVTNTIRQTSSTASGAVADAGSAASGAVRMQQQAPARNQPEAFQQPQPNPTLPQVQRGQKQEQPINRYTGRPQNAEPVNRYR